MTEKYNPYEHVIVERINGILKQEFNLAWNVEHLSIKKGLIENAIKMYNSVRPHLSNHMLTPNKMHKQRKLKPKLYKFKKLYDASIVKL